MHVSLFGQQAQLSLLSSGIEKHGDTFTQYEAKNSTEDRRSDIAVCWGTRGAWSIKDRQEKRGALWLVMERGYLGDRFNWSSLGYGGLNGRASFPKSVDGKRWEKLQMVENLEIGEHDVFPGDYILLAGQVRGDMSLDGIRVDYNDIIDRIRSLTDIPVLFRHHPKDRNICNLRNCTIDTNEHLETTLKRAHALVTINSNASVISALAGVPTFVLDPEGAMAAPVAWGSLAPTQLQNPTASSPTIRKWWAEDMAYTQWTDGELRDGTAWERIKKHAWHLQNQ